jgi:penicillin-binding protein 1A
VAEAAMLAGLPKAPSAYNPVANPKRATRAAALHHRPHVRERLHHREQHAEALEQTLRYRTPAENPVHAEFVAETARQLVFSPSTATRPTPAA